ncbi:NUMOD4 motif-containing HNH endonuclease [Paucilactobacillus sp. N302-9]
MKWKLIPDFEYEISDTGDIRSIKTGNIRKLIIDHNGYSKTNLISCSTKKVKTVFPHREVAKAFIEHSELQTQVNHKDGNKQNNDITNLEWVTSSENQRHAVRTGLKPSEYGDYSNCVVTQQASDGTMINIFINAATACRYSGVSSTAMYKALTGKAKTAGGFIWNRLRVMEDAYEQKENA